MIEAATLDGGLGLIGELDGGVAYVDADWPSPSGAGRVPTLVTRRDGSIVWTGIGAAEWGASELEAEARVAVCFARVVREAVAAARAYDLEGRRVAVTGRGFLASLIRVELGDLMFGESRPGAVIDTTGDRSLIEPSVAEVADGGLVVMAGEPPGGVLPLDLYRDVHVRGLTLVGVSPLRDGNAGGDLDPPAVDEELPRLRKALVDGTLGRPLPLGALLYRLSDPKVSA